MQELRDLELVETIQQVISNLDLANDHALPVLEMLEGLKTSGNQLRGESLSLRMTTQIKKMQEAQRALAHIALDCHTEGESDES